VTRAVLFDLDGTFADTAPDLGYTLNRMLEARGRPPVPLAATRPVTSMGARGLLNVGFGIGPSHADYTAMREEFLAIYEENICRNSRPFPGIGPLLEEIEGRGLRWGIVTNKSERLARILLEGMGMTQRAACIIGGDTTPRFKPHPDSLFAACKVLGEVPGSCIYAGDDRRDIEAAHAAGMKAAAVRWGYLNGEEPEHWGADWIVGQPQELLRCFDA
jgi:phosphoglycolate phosphatase